MGYREIVKVGDPVLKKTSRKVEKFDEKLARLIDDMKETMYKAEGVGLAAVQVGVLRRVVVLDCGDGFKELVNPVIIEEDGVQEEQEGCLSVPGEYGITRRPATVKVQAQDRNGKWFKLTGEELLARAICHEVEHLDGHLFLEHVTKFID